MIRVRTGERELLMKKRKVGDILTTRRNEGTYVRVPVGLACIWGTIRVTAIVNFIDRAACCASGHTKAAGPLGELS